MRGPILSLTLARARRRGATAAISIASVAAAAALIAIISGIGLVASDKTVERTTLRYWPADGDQSPRMPHMAARS